MRATNSLSGFRTRCRTWSISSSIPWRRRAGSTFTAMVAAIDPLYLGMKPQTWYNCFCWAGHSLGSVSLWASLKISQIILKISGYGCRGVHLLRAAEHGPGQGCVGGRLQLRWVSVEGHAAPQEWRSATLVRRLKGRQPWGWKPKRA